MAQLRDPATSELVAVGDPFDLIIIADELGADRVLWDDVGAVDLDALRQVNTERLDSLEGEALKAERARQTAAGDLAPRVARALEAAAPGERTLEPVDVTGTLE